MLSFKASKVAILTAVCATAACLLIVQSPAQAASMTFYLATMTPELIFPAQDENPYTSQEAHMPNSEPFPSWPDPTPYCQRLGQINKSPQATEKCLKDAQSGYDSARSLWNHISEYSAKSCLKFESANPDHTWKYLRFGNCVSEYYVRFDMANKPAQPFSKW